METVTVTNLLLPNLTEPDTTAVVLTMEAVRGSLLKYLLGENKHLLGKNKHLLGKTSTYWGKKHLLGKNKHLVGKNKHLLGKSLYAGGGEQVLTGEKQPNLMHY